MADSERGSHYFNPNPEVASRPTAVELNLPDLSLTLQSDAGVFGRHQIDPGTKLLLAHGPEPQTTDATMLDLGCGYGPIALTMATRNPQAMVWAVDVNQRALDLCQSNAEAAGLDNISVATPDDVPDEIRFDRLWSNPPIRVGKAALHELLATWLARLTASGTAHLVVQKHLGSDSLHRWLEESGWPTQRRKSQSAYRLLDVGPRP